jgi:hypothetical protein
MVRSTIRLANLTTQPAHPPATPGCLAGVMRRGAFVASTTAMPLLTRRSRSFLMVAVSLGACGDDPGTEPLADAPPGVVDAAPTPGTPHALAFTRPGGVEIFAPGRAGGENLDVTADNATSYLRLAWADLDGDGHGELATVEFDNGGQHLVVYDDRGTGFAEVQTVLGDVYAIAAVRLDDNARDDLWLGGANFDRVLCGDGTGFTPCLDFIVPEQLINVIDTGDADADGDQDVAVSGFGDVRTYHNDGGYAKELAYIPPGAQSVKQVAWTALDDRPGDEVVALLDGNVPGDPMWKVWTWDVNQYRPVASVALPTLVSVRQDWADVDGDGDEDLLVCGNNLTHLFRRDGDTFTEIWTAATVVCHAAWGDVDGDGDPDLALMLGAQDPVTLTLLRNDAGSLVEMAAVPGADGNAFAWGVL